MKLPYTLALCAAVGFTAYHFGMSRGSEACPERAAMEAERTARIDAEIAEMLAAPSGRALVCDQVFDLVGRELGREKQADEELP